MRHFRQLVIALWALAGAAVVPVSNASAQGPTTGAISGIVTDSSGNGLEGATITAVNQATGFRQSTQSRRGGAYTLQALETGTYNVSARLIGYRPESRNDLVVRVTQNVRANFQLSRQAVQLNELVTTASRSASDFNPSRQGAQSRVSDSLVRRLPNLTRNITDLIQTSPYVATNPSSGGVSSFAGQNARYNNIQVDGLTAVDRFGLNSDQQLGAQANGRGITLEAIKEFQILLSPFDVRQGNFTGGLTNIITKNGTNDWQGSLSLQYRDQQMSANDPLTRNTSFQRRMYAGSLGGPIVKDRLHFFVAADVNSEQAPAAGPFFGQAANSPVPVPVTQASIDRFNSGVQRLFGFNGGAGTAVANETPLYNVLARLDLKINDQHRLVLRNNYNNNKTQDFGRSNATANPFFDLTSWAFQRNDISNSTGLQLFSNFSNGISNELQVGYNTQDFERILPARAPAVIVENVPNPNGGVSRLRAGAENSSQGNSLYQDILEIRNDLTVPVGRHTLTFGARGEIYSAQNTFTQNSFGVWTFANLDSLDRGVARRFEVGAPVPQGGDPIARFTAATYSLYAQDLWNVTDRLSITAGFRADWVDFQDQPFALPRLQGDFGRSGALPSMRLHASPRIGFNWDVTGDQKNQVRGGVGVFMGPPPFVFMSNTFTNTGNNFSQLVCDPITNRGTTVPSPTGAYVTTTPPPRCPSGQEIAAFNPNGTVGTVNTVSDDIRFPQVARATLGYDRDLGNDWVATIEGTYTYGVNDFFYTNLNQATPTATDRNGRTMYGTIAATGTSAGVASRAAGRIATYVGQENGVFDARNVSGAWSALLMTQLRKRFSNGWEINGSYTYQQARSVIDATSSVARSNFINGRVLSGNALDTQLGVSAFQMPHRFVLTGTYTAPWKTAPTDIAFNYTLQSGTPVVWTATGNGGRGDLNADGYIGNDPIYVPRSASDAGEMLFQNASFFVPSVGASRPFTAAEQAAAFERFVSGQACLRNARGQILERNACANPWWSTLDLSIRQGLPAVAGQRVQLQFEVFNLPNLLNSGWGKIRTRGAFPSQSVLNVVGAQNDAQGRPQMVYTFDPRDADETFRVTNSVANFYRIQAGIRFAF